MIFRCYGRNNNLTNGIKYEFPMGGIYNKVIEEPDRLLESPRVCTEQLEKITVDYLIKRFIQKDLKFYQILRELEYSVKKDDITFDDAVYILFKVKPEIMTQFTTNVYGSVYMPLKKINLKQRNKEILALYESGARVKIIAKKFDMSQRRVYQILNKFNENNMKN